ncbi:MAG: OsmC family peroxiredoxin [Opitutales bacterium]
MQTETRHAEAEWHGSVTAGNGTISTQSGALKTAPYSFQARTQGSDTETNPEELIGASLAGCFAMALSKTLGDLGVENPKIGAKAYISLGIGDAGLKVTAARLSVDVAAKAMSEEQLRQAVATTEASCPLYQLLKPGLDSIETIATLA